MKDDTINELIMRGDKLHGKWAVTFESVLFAGEKEWCEKHFGPEWHLPGNLDGKWACRWLGNRSEISTSSAAIRVFQPTYLWLFEHEHDATLFTLRWS